jgi:hypothetical protein
VDISPNRLAQLGGRNNFTGVGEEKTKGRKLFGSQMNHSFSAQKRAIGFKPEACE